MRRRGAWRRTGPCSAAGDMTEGPSQRVAARYRPWGGAVADKRLVVLQVYTWRDPLLQLDDLQAVLLRSLAGFRRFRLVLRRLAHHRLVVVNGKFWRDPLLQLDNLELGPGLPSADFRGLRFLLHFFAWFHEETS